MFAAFRLAQSSMEQFVHNTHNEWFGTIDQGLARELNTNLLTVDKATGACVLCVRVCACPRPLS